MTVTPCSSHEARAGDDPADTTATASEGDRDDANGSGDGLAAFGGVMGGPILGGYPGRDFELLPLAFDFQPPG